MKKLFISLIIFFSFLIFIDKVKAFVPTAPIYNSNYSSSEINNYFNSLYKGTPFLSYGSSTYDYINNNFIKKGLYKEYGEYYICLGNGGAYTSKCFISNNPDSFYLTPASSDTFYVNIYANSNDKVYYYEISSGSKSSSSKWLTNNSLNNGAYYTQFSNDSNYLRSNLSYLKFSNSNGYNTFKTSDNYYFNNDDMLFYLENGSMKLNTDYKISLNPDPNIFEKEIDDMDYYKMIFNFDLETFFIRDNILDFLYDFSTLGSIEDNGNLNTEPNIEFSQPYLEYVTISGVKEHIYIQSYNDKPDGFSKYWSGTYLNTISSDITSLKLIIPMYDTSHVRYLIKLVSFIPYTISYELDSDIFSYYETLDLSNKYGVMFMPKLIDNSSYISSLFQTRGIESISVYDTYDYKQKPIKTYNQDITNFTYTFDYQNIEHNLFFKVKDNTSHSLIDYDTRYFTYKVFDSKYSLDTVVNPNTGESHTIDISNTNDIDINFKDISSVFAFIGQQLDKSSDAYILFSRSVNSFFSAMPVEGYILITTVLSVLFLSAVLTLGGWK